jgi:environmental stress-induced protein Ves
MRHLRPDDYRRMPWKNGGGTTTEIARHDGADGELDWRVSIADVASDGPFSRFPGCERVIVVIAGAGMVLTHPERGARVTLQPLAPYRFDGDIDTHGTLLAGPVRDFNLITRRGVVRGELAVVDAAASDLETALGPDALLVHCLRGTASVRDGEAGAARLVAGESVLRDGDARAMRALDAAAGTVCLVVSCARVRPATG